MSARPIATKNKLRCPPLSWRNHTPHPHHCYPAPLPLTLPCPWLLCRILPHHYPRILTLAAAWPVAAMPTQGK